MKQNLPITVLLLSVFLFNSCLLQSETSKVSFVSDLPADELVGNWKSATRFENKKMVKRYKSEYLELSKKSFDLRFNENNSIDILIQDNPEITSAGNWEKIEDPEKFTNLKTTWLEIDFKENHDLLSGRYYLTQTADSVFMFKKIWDDFDSSGELRFRKGK